MCSKHNFGIHFVDMKAFIFCVDSTKQYTFNHFYFSFEHKNFLLKLHGSVELRGNASKSLLLCVASVRYMKYPD